MATPKATKPPYIREFPTAERVKAEMQGKDAMETAARQMGAFWQLREIIREMSGMRWANEAMTADEKALLGQYANAYQAAGKPFETYPDRPTWYQLHAHYETNKDFRAELFERFLTPDIHDQWAQISGDTRASLDAVKERREQERLGIKPPPLSPREMARCTASETPAPDCFREDVGVDRDQREVGKKLQGLFDMAKIERPPRGLAVNGVYSGQGGFNVEFGRELVLLGCGGVRGMASYQLERSGNQIQLRLLPPTARDKLEQSIFKVAGMAASDPTRWQGQTVVFAMRPDGKLTAPATIQVTGAMPSGTRTEQTMERKQITKQEASYTPGAKLDGTGYYVETPGTRNVPQYEQRSATCAPGGVLSPTGKALTTEFLTSNNEGVGLLFDVMSSFTTGKNPLNSYDDKVPNPGLRMEGNYAGQDGFDIEFYHKGAVVACRDTVVARHYTVALNNNRILVNIQNEPTPIALELKPDGSLAGSGSVQVSGQMVSGIDRNNKLIYRQASTACNPGILSPVDH
jgi:hypothetical protein